MTDKERSDEKLENAKIFGVKMAVFAVCFTPCFLASLKFYAAAHHFALDLDDKAWTGACIGGLLTIVYFAYPNNFFQRRHCNLEEHKEDVRSIPPAD